MKRTEPKLTSVPYMGRDDGSNQAEPAEQNSVLRFAQLQIVPF